MFYQTEISFDSLQFEFAVERAGFVSSFAYIWLSSVCLLQSWGNVADFPDLQLTFLQVFCTGASHVPWYM